VRPIVALDGIEILGTTGDLDAFEYGGGVIYRDTDRHCFWEFWDAREEGERNFEVFTVPIPESIVEEYDFVDEDLLCEVADLSKQQVRVLARSRNPKDRVEILKYVRACYGASCMDPNDAPRVLTEWEIIRRWGSMFGRDISEESMADWDDYIICDTDDDRYPYEFGRVNGQYFGRYDSYDDTLIAIARTMRKLDGFTFNVFHEYETEHLERIEWDPKEYLYRPLKVPKKKFPNVRWRHTMRPYAKAYEIKSRKQGRSQDGRVFKMRKRAQMEAKRRDQKKRSERIFDLWSGSK
jgi:hypothetical protein